MPIKRPQTPPGLFENRRQDAADSPHPPRSSSLSWQDPSRPRYLPRPRVADFAHNYGDSSSEPDSPEHIPAIPMRSPHRVTSDPFDRVPRTPAAQKVRSSYRDSRRLSKGKQLASPFETPAPPSRPPPATPGRGKHSRKRSRSSRSSTTTTNTSTSRSSRGSKRSRSELSVFTAIAQGGTQVASNVPPLPSRSSGRTVSLERSQPSSFQLPRSAVNRSRMPRCASRYWDETDYLRSLLPDVEEAAEPPNIKQGEGCPDTCCTVCSHGGRHRQRRETKASRPSIGLNSSPEHVRSPAAERDYKRWTKSKKRRKKEDVEAKPVAVVIPDTFRLITPPPEVLNEAKVPQASVEETPLTTHDLLSLALTGTLWSKEWRKVQSASQEDLIQRMREFEAAQAFKRKCAQERKSTGMAGMKRAKTAIARRMGWL